MKLINELKLTKKQIDICNKYGFTNSDDILNFYPYRYQSIKVMPYNKWIINDLVILKAIVASKVVTIRKFNKSFSRFNIIYDNNLIQVIVFNMPWISKIKENSEITISGIFNKDRNIILKSYDLSDKAIEGSYNPIYSLKDKVTSKSISTLISSVYEQTIDEIINIIPSVYTIKYRLLEKKKAIYLIHFPKNEDESNSAIRTLKYEEFLKFNLAIKLQRLENYQCNNNYQKIFDQNIVEKFCANLTYELTRDQKNTIKDILSDLKKASPMYRLVQGDVGSGKTVVAIAAIIANCSAGYQSVFMAPTDILATQHYIEINKLLNDYNFNVCLLKGSLNNKEKLKIINDINNNKYDIIVGTHALFQDNVIYHNLGLVITDEQHRFGTNQRKKIKEKGYYVDYLLMSATPIPRTLATTYFGDMDISTIKTMPNNRKKVITKIINNNSITSINDHIINELNNKRQVYIVCNSIEKNEMTKDVISIYGYLKEYYKDYNVGLLHGNMNDLEKQNVMQLFIDNKINVLVSTIVIEVGVSVSNASTIVIYDSYRFGLSQLHQLRGRVLRGSNQGYCFLLTTKDKQDIERLKYLETITDGFEIANYDMKLRGPGDIIGWRQSGLPSLVLGDIFSDTKIIEASRIDALEIIANQDQNENVILVNELLLVNQKLLSQVD